MKPYKTLTLLNKNKSAEVYYRKALEIESQKLIDYILKEVESSYKPLKAVNNSSITEFFKYAKTELLNKYVRNSRKIIKNWWKKLGVLSRKKVKESLGVGLPVLDDNQVVDLIISRNEGLVQNTAIQTINNIENITYDNMSVGNPYNPSQYKNQTKIMFDRIKRICRDQTEKANAILNEITQRSAGVEFFRWSTAKDERVSTGFGGHKHLEGKIYKWGDVEHYPICDSYGNRGTPSNNRPNCRCVAEAVILTKDYKAKQLSDGSWEIKGVID